MVDTAKSALKILIVDDSSTMRTIVRKKLLEIGIENVDECEDGYEALRLLAIERDFSVVVTDLHMKPVDGMQLVNGLRRDPDLRELSVPVIVMTAEREAMVADVVRDMGAVWVLLKPFQTFELQAALERAVGMRL
jgi:two-component system, chemotaxis family, chemotaxis protein CheY